MQRTGSVLFACTNNAVRSAMAEAILKHVHGRTIYVDSCGVRTAELDPFAVAVMDEIDIDLSCHRPKSFDDLHDTFVDVVISLSPEAQHRAVEMTRSMSVELEYWPTMDPTGVWGSREQKLEAYRAVRDHLMRLIEERFSPAEAAEA